MEVRFKGKTFKIALSSILAFLVITLIIGLILISGLLDGGYEWIEYRTGTTHSKADPANDSPASGDGHIPISAQSKGTDAENSSDEENQETPAVSGSLVDVDKENVNNEDAGQNSASDTRININKAGMDELVTLPYIGEVKAKAIIEYRNTHGPFKSVDELDNVKGIGPKTIEKLKSLVTVE